MSEKYLGEKEWKGFCKNPDWKGDALAKALGALDKAEKAPPDERLRVLDEVDRQAALLLKEHRSEKGLVSYLGEVTQASGRLRKEVEKARQSATGEDHGTGHDPAEELLDPKKLADQLAQCRRDPKRTAQFGFTDAHDKQPAVLALSTKTSGRNLFARLQEATGVKTGSFGSAWIDGTQLMLQVDKPFGGLAKKVRAPVKACGFKISKVVLWAEDGTIFEQDDAPDDDAHAKGGSDAHRQAPDPLKATFDTRLAALGHRLLEAHKERPAEAAKLRMLEAFAREKGAAAQYKAALAALDTLDKLLSAGNPQPTATAPKPSAGSPRVDYAKCRLAWEAAKKKVQADLNRLEQAILDEYRDTVAFEEVQSKLRKLDSVLAAFAENLSDLLDDALNAEDQALRHHHHGEAAGVIRRFSAHAANDPFIAQLESNPFVPIDIRGTPVTTLGQLSRLIA